MSWISTIFDILLHLDTYLIEMITTYGSASYFILFCIIFAETGLVVAPFLPGDSLIFATGAISAAGGFNIFMLFAVLSLAAILGDTVNYWVGSYLGEKAFKTNSRIFKKEYIDKTHRFFEKYGNKTIIIARFVPVVRTFAPFLAGVGKMSYGKFITYNIVGGLLWVAVFAFAGYYFGNIQIVKDNFSLSVLFIIIISFIPVFVEYYRHKRKMAKDSNKN